MKEDKPKRSYLDKGPTKEQLQRRNIISGKLLYNANIFDHDDDPLLDKEEDVLWERQQAKQRIARSLSPGPSKYPSKEQGEENDLRWSRQQAKQQRSATRSLSPATRPPKSPKKKQQGKEDASSGSLSPTPKWRRGLKVRSLSPATRPTNSPNKKQQGEEDASSDSLSPTPRRRRGLIARSLSPATRPPKSPIKRGKEDASSRSLSPTPKRGGLRDNQEKDKDGSRPYSIFHRAILALEDLYDGQNNINERKDSKLQGKEDIVQNAARRVAERKNLAISKVDDDDESMELEELTEIAEPKKEDESIFTRSMKALENSVSALENMYDSTY